MNEEERERTMNFILEHQANFAAGMDRLEGADARAVRRLDKLERNLVRMAVQFRRERKDLRERINALVDAQTRSEDKSVGWQERLARMEEMRDRNTAASEARLARIEELTARNSEDIRRNSEDIRALTRFVSRDGGKQNGGVDEG
jgi:hypothetical protein